MHIYLCINIYVYIFMYIYLCIYIYVYIFIHIYLYIYIMQLIYCFFRKKNLKQIESLLSMLNIWCGNVIAQFLNLASRLER